MATSTTLFFLLFLVLSSLQISAQCTCLVNGYWDDNTIWGTCGGTYPGTSDDVIIDAGKTVTLRQAEGCQVLTLSGTIDLNGNTLTVSYANMSVSTSIINPGGNITGTGTLEIGDVGTLENNATLVNTGITMKNTFDSATLTGTGSLTVGNLSCGEVQFLNYSTLTGNITGSSPCGGVYNAGTLNVLGSYSAFSLNAGYEENTIIYGRTGNQNIKVPGTAVCYIDAEYWHLQTSGSGTKLLSGAITVKGNLTIGSGSALDVSINNYGIILHGNWINNGGTFVKRSGTVTFNAGNSQTISSAAGSETYYRMTVNKSANNIALGGSGLGVLVSNTLTLTSGDIVLGANTLELLAGCALSGASTASYVQAHSTGAVRRDCGSADISVARLYPVGDAANYTPLTLTFNTGTTIAAGAYMSVRVVTLKHPDVSAGCADYINRYWVVNPGNPADFNPRNYAVSYDYVTGDIAGTEANMYTQKYSSGWTQYDPADAANNRLTGNGITTFSDFTGFGSSATPITLYDFTAHAPGQEVLLDWSAESTGKDDNFLLERSADGKTFEPFAEINSNKGQQEYRYRDSNPFPGTSYYRLRYRDLNGSEIYSPVREVFVTCVKDLFSLSLSPNPARDYSLLVFCFPENNRAEVTVKYMTGKIAYHTILQGREGLNTHRLNLDDFGAGVYMVMISSGHKVITQKLVKQ